MNTVKDWLMLYASSVNAVDGAKLIHILKSPLTVFASYTDDAAPLEMLGMTHVLVLYFCITKNGLQIFECKDGLA